MPASSVPALMLINPSTLTAKSSEALFSIVFALIVVPVIFVDSISPTILPATPSINTVLSSPTTLLKIMLQMI